MCVYSINFICKCNRSYLLLMLATLKQTHTHAHIYMQEGICEVLPNVDTGHGYLQKQVCFNETLNLIIALMYII